MNPHLIESAAKAQMHDRLRAAEQRRLIARASAERSGSAARSGSRLRLRSLRAVFG